MRAYVIGLVTTAAIALLLVAAINVAVDPFAIHGSPRVEGFNALKPAIATRQRIFKSVTLARGDWQAVILGTSRAEIGLDPRHAFFRGQRTFNAAMGGETPEESLALFEAASRRGALRQVLYVADFPIFNAHLASVRAYSERNFARWRPIEEALGIDALLQSVATPFQQRRGAMAPPVWSWEPDGRVLFAPAADPRALATESERGYLHANLLFRPSYDFVLERPGHAPLEYVRRMVARCHAEGVELTLLIPPAHARHWEVMAVAGVWPEMEAWKRRLVRINEEEARAAGKAAFPLWDFSGYGALSTEAYPRLGEREPAMRWFSDSSHFTPEAGTLVLDRIRDGTSPAGGLGSLLQPGNLEDTLERMRAARLAWRARHPVDVAEIEAMAADPANPAREKIAARRRSP